MSNEKNESKLYSDEELIWATQLAYCNFEEKDITKYKNIQEIVSNYGPEIYYNYKKDSTSSGDKKAMKESTEKFIEDVAKGDKCKDWKIVSVYDREDKEGIYAVMIDTGNGKSIIAFRGSESVSGEQWFKDWGQADFQIANGKMTSQEKAACKYLDKIANDKNYDKYQDIAVTGHSLGGNLAHVSTIYTASDACTTDMQNRIKQSVSMDGPGHPKEFIEKYSKAITKMQDKMTHYQWSAVGAIFSSLCTGDNYVKVDSSKFHLDAMEYAKYLDDLKKRGVSKTKLNFLATMGLVKELPSFINRHSTASLDPDENGNLKRASGYDIVSKIINKVTNAIDSDDPMQEYVGAMANIISNTAVNIIENGKDLIEMTPHMIECVKDYTKSWGSLIMCINNMSNNKHIPDSEEVALYLGLSAINFSKMVNSAVELNLNGISVFRDITKTISTYTLELHKLINKRANLNIDYRIFKFVYNNLMELKYTPITKLLNIFYGRDEEFNKLLLKILNLFNDAGAYTYPCDPLIFDLNGDGVKTVSLVDGVHFDFDKNGFAEKIGWVSAEDGLLVRDLDKDGKISSGRELMGDLTELTGNSVASNGFQALAYYDENSDGVINSNDAIYSELKLWQDKNQNGTVDDGELMTLSQAGIESINVAYDNIDITDESGNGHSQKGSYTRTDGTTGEIEDVWFVKDAADTVLSVENNEQYYIEETDEIRNLPDIKGKGNQYSLHQAMLRDETGRLQEMVGQYVAEEDVYNRKKMLPNLIYAWTGVLDEDKFGRGEYLSDARKLEALEVITGRDFTSAYGANPVEGAVDFIEDAFDKLVYMYHIQLEMQTTYAGMYATIWQNVDIDENNNIVFKADGLKDYLAPISEQDPEKAKRMITGFIDNMNKTGIASQVDMDSFREELSNLGEEYLYAYDHMGNDIIDGTDGDDTIIGGTGNDKLSGGKGNDTYIFHLGDGRLDNVYIIKAA